MILKTKDLILKPYEEKYARQAHENFFCQKETAKFMLWKPTENVEEAKARLERWSQKQNWEIFLLIHEKSSDKCIGFIGIDDIEVDIYGHVGLCIGLEFKGKGYGTQVLTTLIEYLKSKNVKQLHYSHFKENIASQKLAEKFGFKFIKEGKRVRGWDNKEFDEICYVLNF